MKASFSRHCIEVATSSHERDGTLRNLPTTTSLGQNSLNDDLPPPSRFPVGTSTVYNLNYGQQGSVLITDTSQFTSDDFSTSSSITDVYRLSNGSATITYSLRQFFRRLTQDEFINNIGLDYAAYNVPPVFRVPVPFEGECLGGDGLCPTEELWCETDPECSVRFFRALHLFFRAG